MKLRNILYYLAIIVLITTQVNAQNTNPVVTNVAFSISGTTVTVTYDVADAEQSTVTISMEVSSDNGTKWDYNYNSPTAATGDIGPGINSQDGLIKTITWTYSGVENSNFQIRIYANDETAGGSPCPGIATVDYLGKTYNTVLIGDQCWLKENLDVGTMINGSDTSKNNGIIEKYCYNDDTANCTTYGALYQWDEAMQYVTTSGAQGICPTGWHIPDTTELVTLSTIVRGTGNGNALSAIGQGAGTNTTGFSALWAGIRDHSSFLFVYLNTFVYHWSSTVYNDGQAPWAGYMITQNDTDFNVVIDFLHELYGFSVRCIKN
jgi:uncharacterized protein (TIGR02145 family)